LHFDFTEGFHEDYISVMNQIGRRKLPIVSFGILICLGGFLYFRNGPRETPPGQPPFVRLNSENFHVLIERFNSGDSGLRVLVMLSPT
jgi:hypothetical protein